VKSVRPSADVSLMTWGNPKLCDLSHPTGALMVGPDCMEGERVLGHRSLGSLAEKGYFRNDRAFDDI
jgi:hypothetical protein